MKVNPETFSELNYDGVATPIDHDRPHRDVTMPTGFVFRTYEDTPHVWIQISPDPRGRWFMDPTLEAFARGECDNK